MQLHHKNVSSPVAEKDNQLTTNIRDTQTSITITVSLYREIFVTVAKCIRTKNVLLKKTKKTDLYNIVSGWVYIVTIISSFSGDTL